MITGVGFSRNISGNSVTFSGANGQRLIAPVKSATTDSLTVILPSGVASGYVTVEVADDLSNEYPFTGPGQVLITFGDNGNFNDDIFKLVIDDKVIIDGSTPQRKVGPISVPLTAGTHVVKLVGIRAEDEIGTYYIEFSGNVTSVTGDNLEGRDLLKDSVKIFNVIIGDSNQKFSRNITPLLNLQQE
ncbi:MAG: hypothetical protein ACI89T_001691 [Cognaticolwellia sp.]